jgi:hypothetical protein
LLPFSVRPVPKPGVENGLSGPSPGGVEDHTGFDNALQDVQHKSAKSKDRSSGSTNTESGANQATEDRVGRDTGTQPQADDSQARASEDSDQGAPARDVTQNETASAEPQESDDSELSSIEGNKNAGDGAAPDDETAQALATSQVLSPKDVLQATALDGTKELVPLEGTQLLNANVEAETSLLDPLALERALIAEDGVGLQEELSSIDPAILAVANEEVVRRMPPGLRAQLLGEGSASESTLPNQTGLGERPDLLALDRAVAAEDAAGIGSVEWTHDRPADGNPGLRDLRSLNYERAYKSLQQRTDAGSVTTTDLRPIARELQANGTDINLLDLRVSRLTENVAPTVDSPTGPNTWTVESKLDAMIARLASTDPRAPQSPQATASETSMSLPDIDVDEPVLTRAGEALRFASAPREESRGALPRASEGAYPSTATESDTMELVNGELESDVDADFTDTTSTRRLGLRSQAGAQAVRSLGANQNAHMAASQSIQNPTTVESPMTDPADLAAETLQLKRQVSVPRSPLPAMNRVELTLHDPAGKLRIAVEQADHATREVGVRLAVPEAAMADFNGAGSELEQDLERQGLLLSYFEANANDGEGDASFEDFEASITDENSKDVAKQARVHPSAMRSSGLAGRLLSAVA